MSVAPIVVGTDGSPTANQAVDKAGELGKALGARVDVVMSFNPMPGSAWMASAGGVAVDPGAAADGAKEHAEEVVSRAAESLQRLGVDVAWHVCAGEPAEALMAVATDVGAQMIVVGNRGMTGARRVLGSVPNRVSHHADCCVLIVHTC